MNKKIVFLVSLCGTAIVFLTSGLTMSTFLCGASNYTCWDKLEFLSHELLIFFPFFLFSCLTYFLREEVFRTWLRFAYVWIPLSLIVIYLSAGWTGGGFGIPNVLDQETVAIIFSGLFVIISLFIILISWFRSRTT